VAWLDWGQSGLGADPVYAYTAVGTAYYHGVERPGKKKRKKKRKKRAHQAMLERQKKFREEWRARVEGSRVARSRKRSLGRWDAARAAAHSVLNWILKTAGEIAHTARLRGGDFSEYEEEASVLAEVSLEFANEQRIFDLAPRSEAQADEATVVLVAFYEELIPTANRIEEIQRLSKAY
jgi:hypothetical protein